MYEGKNIHYSQVDNKPLCSYSSRLCKQRRLNGYAFCIRHILEDPTAPFKPCAYTNANNSHSRANHQCTAPVPLKDTRMYCNHHMQTMGLAAKPEPKVRPPRQVDKSRSNHKAKTGKEVKLKDAIQDNRNTFEDRLKSKFNLHSKENGPSNENPEDPYAFPEPTKPPQPPMTPKSERGSPVKVKSSPSHVTANMSSFDTIHSGSISNANQISKPQQKLSSTIEIVTSLFNSTPIAQRYPELAEKLEKARVKPEVKLKLEPKPPIKSSTQRSSRTMNRLQTKIAQNRIKDKLKRTQEPLNSESSLASSPGSSNSSSLPSLPTATKCVENGLRLEPLTCSVDTVDKGRDVSTVSPYPGSLPPHVNHIPMSHSNISSLQQHLLTISQLTANVGTPVTSLGTSFSATSTYTHTPHHPTSTPQAQAVVPGALSINPTLSLFTAPLTNALEQLNPQARPPPQPSQVTPSPPSPAPPPQEVATPTATNHQGALSPLPSSVLPSQQTVPGSSLTPLEVRKCLRSRTALRYYAHCMKHKNVNRQLLPPVIYSSEDSDSEDESPWQREWFYPPLEEIKIKQDDRYLCSARGTKLSMLKSRCRRQLLQLRRSQHNNTSGRTDHRGLLSLLIESAKSTPGFACRAVTCSRSPDRDKLPSEWWRTRAGKHRCVYADEGEDCCNTAAMPYTNHCIKHIMYNTDQQLYDMCTAKFSDNTQCNVPVYDIRHELPLCREHAAKFDNYNKKPELKPKKPRKKTKPSALTRPPKKGKKKKNQKRNLRPQKPMPPLEPTGDLGGSAFSELSVDAKGDETSLSNAAMAMVATTTEDEDEEEEEMELQQSMTTMSGHELHTEHDLAPMSPGTIKSLDLPLDSDLATKFLDEHDLHDVLKRLPDEAFDIFTGKNGEFEEGHVLDIGNVHDSLQELDAETLGQLMGNTNAEDELTKQIAASIFNQSLGSPGHLDDDESELNQGDNLHDLANISTAELKTISQTLNSGLQVSLNNPLSSQQTVLSIHGQPVSSVQIQGQQVHNQVIQGHSIHGHSILQSQLQGHGSMSHESNESRVQQQTAVSLIAAQLAQGHLNTSGPIQIQMPITTLGGTSLTIGPQGTLVPSLNDGVTSSFQPYHCNGSMLSTSHTSNDTNSLHTQSLPVTLNSSWNDSTSFSTHSLPSINTLPIMQSAGSQQSIKVTYPLHLLQGDLAHLLGNSGALEQAILSGSQTPAPTITSNSVNLVATSTLQGQHPQK